MLLVHPGGLDQLPVPDLVQILRRAEKAYWAIVAAAVAVVGDVQWLVQVADEVNEKPQRLGARRERRGGISQDAPVALDGGDDAAPLGAVP